MRLGQLSRTLNVTTSDIVTYLSDNGIEIKDHPNVKLEESAEQKVIAQFSDKQVVEDEKIDVVVQENAPTELQNKPATENKSTEIKEIAPSADPKDEHEHPPAEKNTEQTEREEELEKFEAEKVRLEGLKVLGKIELPEPKRKEDKASPEEEKSNEKEEDPDQVKVVSHSRMKNDD